MKKTFLAAFCVLGFLLITGGAIIEDRPHPLLLNGKPLGNAVSINGNLFVSVKDFATAAGGGATLGPSFQLRGTRLVAVAPGEPTFDQVGKGKEKWQPNALFSVRKAGEISSHIVMNDGKAFIPLADLARAFGFPRWRAPLTLRSGESINFNVAVNGDGILGTQQ